MPTFKYSGKKKSKSLFMQDRRMLQMIKKRFGELFALQMCKNRRVQNPEKFALARVEHCIVLI